MLLAVITALLVAGVMAIALHEDTDGVSPTEGEDQATRPTAPRAATTTVTGGPTAPGGAPVPGGPEGTAGTPVTTAPQVGAGTEPAETAPGATPAPTGSGLGTGGTGEVAGGKRGLAPTGGGPAPAGGLLLLALAATARALGRRRGHWRDEQPVAAELAPALTPANRRGGMPAETR